MCGTCEGIMSGFCPACNPTPDVEETPCTQCNGTGSHLFDDCGNDLTIEQYNAMNPECRGNDTCTACNGSGYTTNQ